MASALEEQLQDTSVSTGRGRFYHLKRIFIGSKKGEDFEKGLFLREIFGVPEILTSVYYIHTSAAAAWGLLLTGTAICSTYIAAGIHYTLKREKEEDRLRTEEGDKRRAAAKETEYNKQLNEAKGHLDYYGDGYGAEVYGETVVLKEK